MMARIKVRRTNREELPGVALLRDAVAAETGFRVGGPQTLDLDMELDPTLAHLMGHDPDGFVSALNRDETVGFGAAHVRSRQWVLSELWVLSQHRGTGAGEALLERLLLYGERSGAREYLAVVPDAGSIVALLVRHDFRSLTPVYELRISREKAEKLGTALSRLLPGQDVTQELLERRGQADLDRIDKLTRRLVREADHVFWLKTLGLNAWFIRQGSRIAGYGYGGRSQIGPIAGTTQEAALAALGFAFGAALERSLRQSLEVRIPAAFDAGVQALLDGGAVLEGVLSLYGRGSLPSFDRYVLGTVNLP